jgi:tetratricopeptide (TPR) repeat protein
MINLIDVYDIGRFVGSMIHTLKATFPYVHVMADYAALTSARRTFVLIAGKQIPPGGDGWIPEILSDPKKFWHLSDSEIRYLLNQAGQILLTDDFVPVENLMADVVQIDARLRLSRKYIQLAHVNFIHGRKEEGFLYLRKALSISSLATLTVYNDLAVAMIEKGDFGSALNILESVIEYNRINGNRLNLSSIYLNKALLFKQMNKTEQASELFILAEKGFRELYAEDPYQFEIVTRLGNCLAEQGQLMQAIPLFREAIPLEPGNWKGYLFLAATLELLDNKTEALDVLRMGMDQVRMQGKGEGLEHLAAFKYKIESETLK